MATDRQLWRFQASERGVRNAPKLEEWPAAGAWTVTLETLSTTAHASSQGAQTAECTTHSDQPELCQ